VSKIHVEEKELFRINSTQRFTKTDQALVALNEDNSTVGVFYFQSWEMTQFTFEIAKIIPASSASTQRLRGIVCNNMFLA